MHALAGVAVTLGADGLGAHLFLGRGEEMTGGRGKASILADATEALIGAVYLEGGLEAARGLVHRLFDGLLVRTPRCSAPGWTGRRACRSSPPRPGISACPSTASCEKGPDHLKVFTATAARRRP